MITEDAEDTEDTGPAFGAPRAVRTLVALAVAFLLAVGYGGALAGCAGDRTPIGPRRQPTVAQPDTSKVKELCDFFAVRALDTLGTDAAQGNGSLLADRPGIPAALHDAVHDFWADGIARPDTADHRATLDGRYAAVIQACRAAGTGWQRP